MSARWSITGIRRASARSKRIALGAVTALVLIGFVWVVVRRGDDASQPAGEARGVDDMAGMNMSSGGSVRLTTQQMGAFGITFGSVEMRRLTSSVRTTGVVTFDETRVAHVSPKIGGFVERMYVDFTGQQVREGQPLLDIYSPDLVAAQQELLLAADLQRDIGRSAVPGVPSSTDLVETAKRRLRLWDISDRQIDAVLSTGRVQRTLTLHSPVAGIVVEKKVVRGHATMPGEQLYTIADLSRVWVDIQLREADAAVAQVGSGADVDVTGVPGRTFKGRIEYVYPTLEEQTRSIRARVAVANTTRLLKPGMFATVRILTPTRMALTVPSSAVLRTGERNIVFVDMGGGALMPHEVQLGMSAGEYVEVLAGLEPGQRVVTSAQFILDSESNLAEVMRAMMSQMSPADMRQMQEMPDMNTKGADMKGMKMPERR